MVCLRNISADTVHKGDTEDSSSSNNNNNNNNILLGKILLANRDKWVPVTTAWRVLRLRVEERYPICKVAANILNKQSRKTDKGWPSSLGDRRGTNNFSPCKIPSYETFHKTSDLD